MGTIRVQSYKRADGTKVTSHKRTSNVRGGKKTVSNRWVKGVTKNGIPTKTRIKTTKYTPTRRKGVITETPLFRLRRWLFGR